MTDPIKHNKLGNCPTCGDKVRWTVLDYPSRPVRMGECQRGHWHQEQV